MVVVIALMSHARTLRGRFDVLLRLSVGKDLSKVAQRAVATGFSDELRLSSFP